MIGFDKVFDTNYGADLTITEEANELIERIKSGKKMPMATSCCPGWENYMEKHYPDLVDHGADLTITEEANELIERIKSGKKMPMATSCCPGWENYMEKHYPDLVDHLATTKSPMQIFTAITKTHNEKQENLDPNNIFNVAFMPCIAKKYEITLPEMAQDGLPDTDAELTTRE